MRKICLVLSAFAVLVHIVASAEPDFRNLPRWRGFNLLEKFSLEWSNKPFVEDDFRMISEFGFNFARLPMDYRTWIKDGDWRRFDESALREIDQAVAWGKKYGIHVCINFHRAPGYCVNKPEEKLSLWTSEEALQVCALHWTEFAKRYRGIPNSELSFNLLNEPSNIGEDEYFRVAEKLCSAIRAQDPDRLIIADGLQYGRMPSYKLARLGIAQATRGYTPFSISHYKAEWVNGDGNGQEAPAWNVPFLNSFLYGPGKKEFASPLEIKGRFTGETILNLRIDTVSSLSRLLVKADGNIRLDRKFECRPGEGEWKKSVYRPEWKIYQNIYDKDFSLAIPDGTKTVSIENSEGDWMTLSSLSIVFDSGGRKMLGKAWTNMEWGQKQGSLSFDPFRNPPLSSGTMLDRNYLLKDCIAPWKEFQCKEKIGIIVGEFGAYNKTPHPVVLIWMEDCLKNWKDAGWGFCLWNFRGSFGVLDSERMDLGYEDYKGHKLDRTMLELLQKY